MKITVHTLIHNQAGVVGQILTFEGDTRSDEELFPVIKDESDYEVDNTEHNVNDLSFN